MAYGGYKRINGRRRRNWEEYPVKVSTRFSLSMEMSNMPTAYIPRVGVGKRGAY